MRLFAYRWSVLSASYKHTFFMPMLATSVLVFGGISPTAQAAQDDFETANTEPSPTAGLQLIDLKSDEVTAANGRDDLLDTGERLEASEDIDNWSDKDAFDEDVNDGSDELYNDTPTEVAEVSLNAISPETLKTFVTVIDLVRREYVDAVNDEVLFNNAMSGMLTKLDSYAEFLDAEAYDNLRAFTQGDVGDVGLQAAYQPDEGYWVVTDVIEDSSAYKKNITVGDYLHQIGDFKLDENRKPNDIKQLLTGIAGSQIDVVVSKAGRRKRAVTLQRNNSHPQLIETQLIDGLVIIRLSAFQDNSREQILQSLTTLEAPVTGILLDVRDNPGGVLGSAVKIASLFMDNTDVVQVKSRNSKLLTLTTQGAALLKPLPLVILQNRYSASAAEVLASSLQTQKRAIIVGEVSYGKGSVQSVISLNNEQAVKLTVAHYLTATGAKIEKIGVLPDIVLSGNERTWEQQALDLLRQQVSSSGLRFINKNSVDNSNQP